ncbi:MAG: ImmA/IrrE family metallo-endopeptidase [Oligosphaeraceae bacterium]
MRRQYDEVHRMPNSDIEQKAIDYTFRYTRKYGAPPAYPLDLASLLDVLDDIRVETRDLVSEYGPGTLGALMLDGRETVIALDSSIDPEENGAKQGIYNFSLGHEAGHWVLHAPTWLAAHRNERLFGTDDGPLVLYRSHHRSHKDEIERQADSFSSYLLMPKQELLARWRATYGDEVADVHEELEALFKDPNRQYGFYAHVRKQRDIPCRRAREFAPAFGVSPISMQYRLAELHLLKLEYDRQLTLF